MPALTRDLEIDYTALSLVAPEKVLFRYKLENYDRDWQDAGNRRQTGTEVELAVPAATAYEAADGRAGNSWFRWPWRSKD